MKNSFEFLYGHWATPFLENARGARWRELIDRIAPLDEIHPDALAFSILMIRVNDCFNCSERRYRMRGGCANCSVRVLGASDRPTEDELMTGFGLAQAEILELQQPKPGAGTST